MEEQEKVKSSAGHKAATIVGIVLCVLLAPILIINLTMIIKGFVNKDEVPTFGGYAPLIVLTDSMYPKIESGDLIIVRSVDAEDIKVHDVISFFDPESGGTAVVTHRVNSIFEKDGKLFFRTQGDANNTEDKADIPAENLVGIWTEKKLDGFGSVAMFLQSTPGLIICIAVPVVMLAAYEFIRRKRYDKNRQQDTDNLLKELEELRKLKAESGDAVKADTADENQTGADKGE